MIILHHASDLIKLRSKSHEKWIKSGFVPTMGALHQGHISLINTARKNSDITICSIFVNPSQFNNPSDFEKYPKTVGRDIQMLEEAGCDILFLPDVDEIYPNGWKNEQSYPLGSLESLLEGYYRPGHFQGVCQVVHRLLDLVQPAAIFMGEKDFQQCMVVSRLIELEKLPVALVTCPTLREPDGLAMSSRNLRLTPEQRLLAPAIYREMQLIKADLNTQLLRTLEVKAAENLLQSGFKSVDYVSIADPATLLPIQNWEPGMPVVLLVAAFLGEVRLIDNLVID
jgi:pantoate--beta-alanine ligase